MNNFSRLLTLTAGVLWLSLPAAYADPFVIQQGFFLAVPSSAMSLRWWNPSAQVFGATMLEADIRLFDNVSLPASPAFGDRLNPGQSVSVTHTFEGSGAAFLSFPSPTEPYSLTVSNANFQFTGGAFLIPAIFPPAPTGDEDLYFVRQAFTMRGSLAFLASDGTRIVRELSGSGIANLGLQPDRATGESIVQSLGYSFERNSPSAVPEPATLMLFAFGVAGAAGGRFRRRD